MDIFGGVAVYVFRRACWLPLECCLPRMDEEFEGGKGSRLHIPKVVAEDP